MGPISAAIVTALAASQFVVTEFTKGMATEGGKQIAVTLWEKIKQRFHKDDRALEAIAAVETEKSEEAVADLTTYVKSEMKRYPEFDAEVQKLAQKIININQQSQQQTVFNVKTEGQSAASIIGSQINNSGDNIGRDKIGTQII